MIRLVILIVTAALAGSQCPCGPQCECGPDCACEVRLSVAARLQQATVHLYNGTSHGSGVLFRSRDGGVWVWTAAHVVTRARNGENDFRPIQVTLPDRSVVPATVVRYNAAEELALLRLDQADVAVGSVTFHRGRRPGVGTELYHVGSPTGSYGQGSVTTGVISSTGRTHEGQVYDQSSTPVFGGSSGGAICLRSDGRLLGLVSMGFGPLRHGVCSTMVLYVPSWRVVSYARRTGVLFAVDNRVAVPGEKDIRRGGIEQ